MTLSNTEAMLLIQGAMFFAMLGAQVTLLRVTRKWLSDLAEVVNKHAEKLSVNDSRFASIEATCSERHGALHR